MTQTILLTIALFAVSVTAISYYLNDKISKFITITLFVILANAVYFSLDGVKGWPAEDATEVKGILASVVIVNPSDTDPGAIYIGLYPTVPLKWYEYRYPRYAPKTYFVKYTNDRAAKFEEAKQAVAEGREVRINGIPPETSDGKAEGDGSISDMIGDLIDKIMPNQNDTYKPKVPDIEIMKQELPPEKGSQ